MLKSEEGESLSPEAWVEKSLSSNIQHTGTSKSERKGLQDGRETSIVVVWFGDGSLTKLQEVELKMVRFSLTQL